MRRIDNQSFWRFFRCYVGCFAVAIEPLARSFGHPVAQHVAQLGVVGFALLTQFLELLGIVHQFFHRLDVFFMTSFLQRIRLAAPYWPGRLPRFDGLDALSESLQFIG